MDRATLVARLRESFLKKKSDGLIVDAIGLVPAYHGIFPNCYTLGVSAPSLHGKDNYDKMDFIIDILFECLTEEERGHIDRVRVFNSLEELDLARENDFEEFPYEGYDTPVRVLRAELFEVA
jgi:hypothetical protein